MTIVSDAYIDAALRAQGWTRDGYDYKKGSWEVIFDTSSWMMPFTGGTRVFDVHVPDEYEAGWTANLIEHLCSSADETARLRMALEKVQQSASLEEAINHAKLATERRR